VIDVQGKLAGLMHRKEFLFDSLQKLIRGVQVVGIPILWTEQNPRGLGGTVPEIAMLLSAQEPIEKMSFSCCGSREFLDALAALDRGQVLVAGIEAHVCVYQTVTDLVKDGYEIEVVADAISSRTEENRQTGLAKMCRMGAGATSVEMALFELLRTAEEPRFKEMLQIIK
jgi:nicotinamidase-related amidase